VYSRRAIGCTSRHAKRTISHACVVQGKREAFAFIQVLGNQFTGRRIQDERTIGSNLLEVKHLSDGIGDPIE
jgi:hypothetical protein